jgi:hypothetical protein
MLEGKAFGDGKLMLPVKKTHWRGKVDWLRRQVDGPESLTRI